MGKVESASGSRGRPRRAVRRTPRQPGWLGCEDRIAWLLRANRFHGQDDGLATATKFATSFRGGCWPEGVSASQISRWETAASPAKFWVLRRYEQLLGLPPYQLVTVADWIYRQAKGSGGPPILDRCLNPTDDRVYHRTEQLLDKALSTDLMSGTDWDELSSHLAALRTAFVYPSTIWAELAERLLAELILTNGTPWLPRNEALTRLMAHPQAGGSVIAACAAMAADPTSLVVIEPIAILDTSSHAQANRAVLAQLTQPTSDRAQRGALRASIGKVAHRHFTPEQLEEIVGSVTDLLTDPDLQSDARQLAAEILRRAPAAHAKLRRAIPADSTTASILAFGQTMVPNAAHQVVERVILQATTQLERVAPSGLDPMLTTLVGELLFSPSPDMRLSAGQLIAASPYREPVGAALSTELTAALKAREVPLTTAILGALPFIGRARDRSTVERLVVASGISGSVVETAAWTIGHLPGRSQDRFWLAAINQHGRSWHRTRSSLSNSALRGLSYGLGISRQENLLAKLSVDMELPSAVRAAAKWWLAIPRHIRASADL